MRKVLLITTGLIVVLIGAITALLLTVDPNNYKKEIALLAQKNTGRKVTIAGDISFSIFPWIGLRLEKTTLGNAPGFGPEPMAKIKTAKIRVKLLPLLDKRIEAGRIALEGVQLHLAINKQGKNNWQDLKKQPAPPSPPSTSPSSETPHIPEEEVKKLAALSVSGVEIFDAKISWQDQRSDTQYTLDNFHLESGLLQRGIPLDLSLNTDFRGEKPEHQGSVTLTTRIHTLMEKKDVRLEKLNFLLQAKGKEVSTKERKLQLKGDYNISFDNKEINSKNLTLKINVKEIDTLSSAAVELQSSAKINWRTPEFSFEGWKITSTLQSQMIANNNPIKVHLEGSLLTGNLQEETLHAKDLHLSTLDANLLATIKANHIRSNPQIKGQWYLQPFNPRALLKQLKIPPPETQSPQSLRHFEARGNLHFKDHALELGKLNAKLDKTQLTGRLTITNPDRSPGYQFRLEGDQIDLNAYLPPKSTPQKQPTTPSKKSKPSATTALIAPPAAATLIPIEKLRPLNLDGRIRFKQVKAEQTTIKNIFLAAKAKKGIIKIKALKADLYEGRLTASGSLNVQKSPPRFSLQEKLYHVNIGAMLQDFTQQRPLEGVGELALNLHGSGNHLEEIKRTLSGTTHLKLTNGVIKDLDILEQVRTAYAQIKNRPLTSIQRQGTPFSNFNTQATIKNGLINNHHIQLHSPAMNIKGRGSINLVNEKINYRLQADILRAIEGLGKSVADFKGAIIPVTIKGQWNPPPKISVDLSGLIASTLKTEAKKKLEKKLREELGEEKLKKLEQKLPGEVKELLNQLPIKLF
ncbi:AsmA family protein [Magnetococcales bacterium HHB-1]